MFGRTALRMWPAVVLGVGLLVGGCTSPEGDRTTPAASGPTATLLTIDRGAISCDSQVDGTDDYVPNAHGYPNAQVAADAGLRAGESAVVRVFRDGGTAALV